MPISRAMLAFLSILAFAGLAAPAEAQRTTPSSSAQIQLSFASVASRASPAVVNVYADHRVAQSMFNDPFFSRFGGGVPRDRIERSLGSGVIVRGDGIIVTNNHVIEGGTSLKVVLADRREFNATVMLADPRVDLAVLKISVPGETLPTLPFADTRNLQVGDLVIAIGNPFGLSQTVTSGIISALARTDVGVSDYSFFIQTDASINRGNSGGALVDMSGELVGINSVIISQSGDSSGIGFAIPAEMVRRVVQTAASGGHSFVQPWIGARLQAVTPELARSIGLDRPDGVLVAELYPRAAGERAGLQRGDVILQVAGADVHDEAGVRYQFATQDTGSRVPLIVQRASHRLTLTATAEAPPGGSPAPVTVTGQNPLSGSRVVTLTPATAEAAGLDPFAQGVFIQALAPTGFAARVGFHPGDIIDEINSNAVRSADQVQSQLNAGTGWIIGVQRGGQHAEIRFGR